MQTEPQNLKRIGREYRLKDHPSMSVRRGAWYWHSQGIGGYSPVQFLVKVRGMKLIEAIEAVQRLDHLNTSILSGDHVCHSASSIEQTSLCSNDSIDLPRRHVDNKRVIAYLQSRGIDRDTILDCIDRGDLYESSVHHNCVFLGKDETGTVRYATIRSTVGRFMMEVEGSDKRFGFAIPPSDEISDTIACFESAIDALSHQSLIRKGFSPTFDGWRISTGGSSTLALDRFLKIHPQVTRCFICTDNDPAGEALAERIQLISGIPCDRVRSPYGNDWNDALRTMLKSREPPAFGDHHVSQER